MQAQKQRSYSTTTRISYVFEVPMIYPNTIWKGPDVLQVWNLRVHTEEKYFLTERNYATLNFFFLILLTHTRIKSEGRLWDLREKVHKLYRIKKLYFLCIFRWQYAHFWHTNSNFTDTILFSLHFLTFFFSHSNSNYSASLLPDRFVTGKKAFA